jgi:predicted transcriptional regulator
MVTSYDDIWSCFLDNCGLDLKTLPNTTSEIHREIRNGVRNYNIKTDECEIKLEYDDNLEELNRSLDDNRLKLLALIIKETICKNELQFFESIYQFDMKEVNTKFYREQVSARQSTISDTKREIIELLTNMDSRDIND